MKHLELHILQSFPVVCLNRDELNSPKTAFFGGVQRARVSSQSWKRAVRERAKELNPRFQGERTRLIVEPLHDALRVSGVAESDLMQRTKELIEAIGTFDEVAEKKGDLKVKTLFFTTPAEIQALAKEFAKSGKAKQAVKAIGPELRKDAADIALFGRMVANDHTLTIEGATMFAHALSTHKVESDLDFFSAVDDRQPAEQAGAGMTGSLEFNSATYYRFAALNLDLLKGEAHLGTLTPKERQDVVKAFVDATLTSVPVARRNSMNGHVLPGYVLGIVRKEGHPVQLVNAFENPIRANGKGLFEASREKLNDEYERLNTTWGLKKRELCSVSIPEKTLEVFLNEMTSHVD